MMESAYVAAGLLCHSCCCASSQIVLAMVPSCICACLQVLSMSIGGPSQEIDGPSATCRTTRDGYRAAICAATAAGVTVVAAAGNEGTNLAQSAPAMYPEVLTVTAMADSDGRPGRQRQHPAAHARLYRALPCTDSAMPHGLPC